MRFPIYESLYFLNRNFQDLVIILEEIKKAPGIPKKAFEAYNVEIQYLRSHATQDILEVMNDKEINEMAALGQQKKAYEDSLRDLDDVYFEVQEREEQRRKQGLPSLIGILRGYRPSAADGQQADVEPSFTSSSQAIRSGREKKPRSGSQRRNASTPKTQTKRRPRKA